MDPRHVLPVPFWVRNQAVFWIVVFAQMALEIVDCRLVFDVEDISNLDRRGFHIGWIVDNAAMLGLTQPHSVPVIGKHQGQAVQIVIAESEHLVAVQSLDDRVIHDSICQECSHQPG